MGFLWSAGNRLGFNPSSGLHSTLSRELTKLFGLPSAFAGKHLAPPLDFSVFFFYMGIDMRGNNRGYRGRQFSICENTLDGGVEVRESYKGILQFDNGKKHEFVSNNSNLKENTKYELYAGGIDSRPSTHTVLRVVEVREVSER